MTTISYDHSMIVKIKNAPKLRDIEQPVLVGISSLQKLLKLVPVFTSIIMMMIVKTLSW